MKFSVSAGAHDEKARHGWSTWIPLLLGVYLVIAPALWTVGAEAVGYRTQMAGGLILIAVAVWTVAVRKSRVTEWIKAALGCWLLIAPFLLGYGSVAAWNARGAGVLTLALVVLDNDPLASWTRLRANILRYRQRSITPGDIVEYQDSQGPPSAEVLSGQIIERADQIHRTLLGEPSEIEVEICALGCSACMDDLITLALLVSEEQMRSGPLRRMKLRAAYRCASGSLSRTRQALGTYTVIAPSGERHQK